MTATVTPAARPGLSDAAKAQWSRTYRDRAYHALPWFSRAPYPWVQRAVEENWWAKGTRILDIGCGAGTNSLYLARSGFNVTGIDVAEGAIEAARQRASRAGVSVDFRIVDALDTPFPDGHFGGAIDIGCFHTLPIELRRRYSSEVARVLRPRRTFALSWVAREYSAEFGPSHRPSVEEATAAFEEEFLFQQVEFRPSHSGRQFRGALPVYFARLGRRSFPRPPAR